MENFNLSYIHEIDSYFDPELLDNYSFKIGSFDGKSFSEYPDDDEYMEAFNSLRRMIKRDMQNIIITRVNDLNNNDSLINELNTVIDTIDNGIDFDFMHGENFAFRTDKFLCFNNYENYVDEPEWGILGEDASTCETVVIIDNHLKNFYFIRTTKKICSASCSTTINAYQIKDRNVKKRIVNFKKELALTEHSDEEIQKILSLVS